MRNFLTSKGTQEYSANQESTKIIEKKNKRRIQNNKASVEYRAKVRKKNDTTKDLLQKLKKDNAEFKEKISHLTEEINTFKKTLSTLSPNLVCNTPGQHQNYPMRQNPYSTLINKGVSQPISKNVQNFMIDKLLEESTPTSKRMSNNQQDNKYHTCLKHTLWSKTSIKQIEENKSTAKTTFKLDFNAC